jgi:hypothetical protein
MKTAIQELIDKFSNYDSEMIYIFKDEIKQALEKEKEQIKEAWIATDNKLQRLAAEEYYNQTYNQNK